MNWFSPKLGVGERVVWRCPKPMSARNWMFAAALSTAIAAGLFAFEYWLFDPEFMIFFAMNSAIGGLGVFGAFVIGQLWRIVVTDRRMVYGAPLFWQDPRDIPLEEIEEVRRDIASGLIFAHFQSGTVSLPLTDGEMPALQEAIARAKSGMAAA